MEHQGRMRKLTLIRPPRQMFSRCLPWKHQMWRSACCWKGGLVGLGLAAPGEKARWGRGRRGRWKVQFRSFLGNGLDWDLWMSRASLSLVPHRERAGSVFGRIENFVVVDDAVDADGDAGAVGDDCGGGGRLLL